MSDATEPSVAVVIRVATPDHPAFQLRKGEEGLSVFDPDAVDPALTEEEILDAFKPGSIVVLRSFSLIALLGLDIVACEGADTLPNRLRIAHRELRPSRGISRGTFKAALRDLE